jgi:hypothetical protein
VLAAVLCLAFSQVLSAGEEPKRTSLFNQDWLKTLVSIEVAEPNKDPAGQPNFIAIGSGFIVGTPGNHLALVTAKHVVFDDRGKLMPNLIYRINRKEGPSDPFPELLVGLWRPEGWFKSERHDVACRLIIKRREGSDYKRIAYSQFLTTPGIEVGTPVYVIGFPLRMRSEEHAMPILRRGMVARTEPNNILLDAFVFPGNSGGPVVYAPTDISVFLSSTLHDQRLVGLVSESVSYTEVAISAQTRRPRITFEDNSGLCNIVPASAILELLESPEFVAVDMKHEAGDEKTRTDGSLGNGGR